MPSQYSTKVKVRIGLGILSLIVARVVIVAPAVVCEPLGWAFTVAGVALCVWGGIAHGIDKGYQPPDSLRWLLVLPAAVSVYAGIAILASCFVALAFDLVLRSAESGLSNYPFMALQLLVRSAAGSYGFVLAGARTAPKDRFIYARVLAISYVCFSGFYLFGSFVALTFAPLLYGTEWLWYFLIPWVSGWMGAILACVQVRRHEVRLQKAGPSQGEQEL